MDGNPHTSHEPHKQQQVHAARLSLAQVRLLRDTIRLFSKDKATGAEKDEELESQRAHRGGGGAVLCLQGGHSSGLTRFHAGPLGADSATLSEPPHTCFFRITVLSRTCY